MRAPPDPQREGPSAESVAAPARATPTSIVRSRLFLKYVGLLIAVVTLALIANGIFDVWFSFQEQKASLLRIQREQAEAAAGKIGQFISEIERQVGWTTQLPWSASTLDQRRFDALRLLRQVPAITELAEIDSTGHEQLRVSRLAMDVVGSGLDVSNEPAFAEAVAHKTYYGPVYFRRESEPYMTLSLAGTRRDAGVSIAQVNLKLIEDVLSQIKFTGHGHAYVVDAQGRLIAHPDISLVLRNTDMSQLAQVRAARANAGNASAEHVQEATDIQGQPVLSAYAPVSPLNWLLFVETPAAEAYAPLYASIERTGYVLLGALALAFVAGLLLAGRMVVPIQALRAGAARLGSGDLSQRIAIKTGDEVEGLADQFNEMAGRLQESYANLEHKVEVRTRELSESLEQQTATSEVLGVISSSHGELKPVFDTMLKNALRICDAAFGALVLYENGLWRTAAVTDADKDTNWGQWLLAEARSFGPETALGRIGKSKQVLHISDLRDDIADTRTSATRAAFLETGARTFLGAPLLRSDELVGAIVFYRREVNPFTDKQIKLLQNFAAQAVIAIENARLLAELRARTEDLGRSVGELRALGEVSQAVNSTLDLENVLETIVAKAVQLSNTDAGAIYVFDDAQHDFDLRATYGMDEEMIAALRHARINAEDRNVATMLTAREPVQNADLSQGDITEIDAIIVRGGYRSRLTSPLIRGDDIVGMLVVRRRAPGSFPQNTVDLIKTFAAQSAVAIQNARLYANVETRTRELAKSLQDLHTAQDRLVQTEKLASLGQLTAGIAHEIKNPLNFVNNFSSISVELIDELQETLGNVAVDGKTRGQITELSDMLRGNLEKVVLHGKRADSIVKNMLLHSRQGSGEHQPVEINALVEESLNLAYHGARAEKQGFNITLERSFDPTAGKVDLFPQEITRVLLNLISNGFYAATKRKAQIDGANYEPKLGAATKNLGESIEIRIRDNGTGIPPEVKEKMFNPFFTTKPAGEGTGLGLSLSHDIIVKQHAGSIEVDTQPGEFTEFRIVLPRKAAAIAKAGGSA